MAPIPIPKGEPAAFIACRSLGHAWDSIPTPGDTPRPSGVSCVWLFLRCTRCGTTRQDEVSLLDGGIAGRRYHWPDNYRHAKDDGLDLSRNDWRAAYLKLVGNVPRSARSRDRKRAS